MAFLSDEEKQTLLDHYFNIEWCDDVSDLRCTRCHLVAIDHHVSSCQHIFCKTCRKFYNDEDRPMKCPKCQEHITQPNKKDFDVEVKIHQIKMFCPNKKFGCKHADQLRNIPAHLLTCANTREAVLPRRSGINIMDAVNKMVENAVKEKFNQLERKAEDINSKVNTLTERIASVDKEIEGTIVGIGVAAKKYAEEFQSIKSQLVKKQTIKKNKSLHQKKMEKISDVESMRKNISSMTQEVTALRDMQSEELITKKAKTCKWTITDWNTIIRRKEWTIESDVFTFIGYEYEITARMEKRAGIIAVYLQFKDGNTVNKDLNYIGFTKCKYTIRHRSIIQKRKDITYETDLWFYDCFGHSNWVFGQGVSSIILTPSYTKNNSITIIISLEPPSIDRSFVSNNGILTWTVDNYKSRKQGHLYCENWSPSFYTSPGGYRVKARLLMNNRGPMLVEVNFLTGEHDHLLSIDFPHTTTVTLFNQALPLKNLVKIELRKNVEVYTIELERSNLIERNGFIKDDSLVLKVVIEPV